MKVLNIIGTRPEAIKMAILHKLLLENEKFQPILCLTGQHRSLASEVLDLFDLVPDYCCFLNGDEKTITHSISTLLSSLQDLVQLILPDLIIVQGDTLSSYCGALVAFLNKIPASHVEAGLRTHNKWSPFPEEIFRKFNDMLADIHLAPSDNAIENLLAEGVNEKTIFKTGNTGIDALVFIKKAIENSIVTIPDGIQTLVNRHNHKGEKLILLTAHRREGQAYLIPKVLTELNHWIDQKNCRIIFPIHPNPVVRRSVQNLDLHSSFLQIEPLPYQAFIWLMMQVDLIITDSGGIQEEAPYLGKPLIVLRDHTERQEVLNINNNKLLGGADLITEIEKKLSITGYNKSQPYGDGNASEKIVSALEKFFCL